MMDGDKKKRRSKRSEPPVKKADPSLTFDYKDATGLAKFTTERGKILGRERSGLNSKQQRSLMQCVKRARMLALLPFAN